MNLKNIKLIATDLDGTLLNSKHEVSETFLNQFKILQSHNIKFVAASGRPYYSIKDKLHTIQNDIIIVAENGGIIADKTKILASKSIPFEVIKSIANTLDPFKEIVSIYCTKDKAFIKQTSENNINHVKEYYSNYELINSTSEISEDVVKIALYHYINSETNVYPHVKKFNKGYKVIISSPNWVDIAVEGINKGNALSLIQDKYGITEAETLAFGDFNNDIEMLKKATFSFAMENAHKEVKSVARYSTSNNDDFGVEKILDKLIVQKTNSRKQ